MPTPTCTCELERPGLGSSCTRTTMTGGPPGPPSRETLAAGTYTIEATTYGTGETGSFTLAVAGLGTTGTTPPGPEPTDQCGQTLTGDGAVTGQWAEGCDSQASGRGYARYYAFTLGSESAVTITLESQDADTYLYLRAGEARSGEFLYQNDDDGGTTRSTIQETLAAGTYTIEATTYGTGETGSFTLTVSGLSATAPTPPGPADLVVDAPAVSDSTHRREEASR